MQHEHIYRIATRAAWEAAQRAGFYEGADVDARDGYLHFSTAAQVGDTLRLHYADARDLVLLTVATKGLDIVWEPSRGGDLFPYLYAALPVSAVARAASIIERDGAHILPPLSP